MKGAWGGLCKASTISGGRGRGDGMLRNRLYAGELVHNRTSKIVEPLTRTIRIRPGDAAAAKPAAAEAPALGLGRCGVCGAGWIKVNAGFWGCAGARNGAGCSNTRLASDAGFQARVLSGLKDRLLDPEAVSLFVREYHEENARRDREEGKARRRVERKIADATVRIDRLVEAIASGGSGFAEVREKLVQARSEREGFKDELASFEGERAIAFHPPIAADYRQAIGALDQALAQSNAPEVREDAIPRIRALIRSITVVPASVGRGVDIENEGRLASILELAAGLPVAEPVMITMERVKGIEPSS